MTAEQRRYIIYEHYRGKKLKIIAGELGITPQSITNDRRRHKDVWQRETNWLELKIKSGTNEKLDEIINENRETLKDVQSRIEACKKNREVLLAEHLNVEPEVLKKQLKSNVVEEVELARAERMLCLFRAKLLTDRYELS